MTRLLILALIPLLLGNDGGCGHKAPPSVVVVRADPRLPAECFAPDVEEPRLPDRDIFDDEAARDREALKRALRKSKAQHSICRSALEAQGKRS